MIESSSRWPARALLVVTALCALWDARAVTSLLRQPPALRASPRALYGAYAGVLQQARQRVPEDEAILALWDHQPQLFASSLAPRPVFASPEWTSRQPRRAREFAAKRGIRWIVGRELVRLPGPRGGPGP